MSDWFLSCIEKRVVQALNVCSLELHFLKKSKKTTLAWTRWRCLCWWWEEINQWSFQDEIQLSLLSRCSDKSIRCSLLAFLSACAHRKKMALIIHTKFSLVYVHTALPDFILLSYLKWVPDDHTWMLSYISVGIYSSRTDSLQNLILSFKSFVWWRLPLSV